MSPCTAPIEELLLFHLPSFLTCPPPPILPIPCGSPVAAGFPSSPNIPALGAAGEPQGHLTSQNDPPTASTPPVLGLPSPIPSIAGQHPSTPPTGFSYYRGALGGIKLSKYIPPSAPTSLLYCPLTAALILWAPPCSSAGRLPLPSSCWLQLLQEMEIDVKMESGEGW